MALSDSVLKGIMQPLILAELKAAFPAPPETEAQMTAQQMLMAKAIATAVSKAVVMHITTAGVVNVSVNGVTLPTVPGQPAGIVMQPGIGTMT